MLPYSDEMEVDVSEVDFSPYNGYFARKQLDSKYISHLSKMIEEHGTELPAPIVFKHPETGRLIGLSGFHTAHAAMHAGIKKIRVKLASHEEQYDLLIESYYSNAKNGRPPSPEDQTRNANKLLELEQSWRTSNSLLAEYVGCSESKIRHLKSVWTGKRPKFTGKEPFIYKKHGEIKHSTEDGTRQYIPIFKDDALPGNIDDKDSNSRAPNNGPDEFQNLSSTAKGSNSGDSGVGANDTTPVGEAIGSQSSPVDPSEVILQLDENEHSQLKARMVNLKYSCSRYNRTFCEFNDGKSEISANFLKKINTYTMDVRDCTDEMCNLLKAIGGWHDR